MNLPSDFLGIISFSASSVAHLVFTIVSALALVATVILFFHWRKYGMGGVAIALSETLYLTVAASLLAVAFFSIN